MGTCVDIGGGRLFTEVVGGLNRPWLVLSNSLATDHTMWSEHVGWLARDHRLLLYDTRGHGGSTPPDGPLSLADLVADVVAVMDHHHVERAAFLGLSLGGMTGLGLALHHPERLSRLVCCDARADAPEPFIKGWTERIERVHAQGLEAVLDETLDRWLTPEFRAANAGRTAEISKMVLRTSVAGYVGGAEALLGLDYRNELHRITLPSLFVVGADDPAASVETMRDMAGAVRGGRLAVVPDARHLASVDNKEGFRAAVEEFLATP
jgi:3-oxoadipate enol-lactonase